jgi:CBS domain containing-hemolysin-like protein
LESIALILACLLGSAFFSGSETALLRLSHSEVEAGIEEGSGPAGFAIRDLLQSTSRLLVTILLGNNVVNILGAAVASALAVSLLGPELGITVATVAMTLLVLIFCEVLPKAIAAAHPRGVAGLVALPLYLFHRSLRPVHYLFAQVVDPLVRRVAGRTPGTRVTTEEVLSLARLAPAHPRAGDPVGIIGAAARAADMTVEEIMVERPDIVAFPVSMPPAELLDNMLEERYTRTPVYEESIDRFVGVVHLKDLVRLVRGGGDDVREILRPVLRVPERKPILPLLAEMQRGFVHLAIVKDEHGITQGLVTAEDVLEELVGEIRDEHDREELQSIRPRGVAAYEALGRIKVLDFNRQTGWELPAERGDTLSGLVFNLLGRAPRRGDVVEVPGFHVEVGEVSGTRIARVMVRRAETPASQEPAP